VVRVAFTGSQAVAACAPPEVPAPSADQTAVQVFFTCAADLSVVGVTRVVPQSEAVLRAALHELLAGPTAAEQRAGLTSLFSAATKDMLKIVTVDDAGLAVVDFHDLRTVIPNASGSTASTQLLRELDGTVFQFPSVRSVEYRIEGSCPAFFEWLQRPCEFRERS
jgi:spore germination protein GerM